MKSQLWWKWLIVAGFAICSLWLALPPEPKIRPGLDLRGGYSFTVELDKAQLETTVRERMPEGTTEEEVSRRVKEALATADDTAVEIIRNRIDSIGTEEPVITKGSNGRIYVQMPGASDAQRDRAEDLFRRYGDMTTFVCRLLPVIRQLISIPAGLSGMHPGRFTAFNAAGAGAWNAILLAVGAWFGHLAGDMGYPELLREGKRLVSDHYGWVLLGLAAVVALWALLHRAAVGRGSRVPNGECRMPNADC